ncbi:MAG: nucleoside monophosphate kinase [Epsilonproteobacteria bacterium]|nr:nucleoside monophosphate kinase [Campylobacterota bacterium]
MNNHQTDKTIFVFFGAPGSGKGTLASLCVERLGFKVLSTGKLFREHIAAGDELGKTVSELINAGKLVSDDIVNSMVQGWLEKNAVNGSSIILDGYPRTRAQAELMREMLAHYFPDFVFCVIKLEIPDFEIVKRLSNRLVCSNKKCQKVFRLSMLPKQDSYTCDECGSELSRRPDDEPDVVKHRLEVYRRHEQHILDFYNSVNQRVDTLNVSNISPEQVFESFAATL